MPGKKRGSLDLEEIQRCVYPPSLNSKTSVNAPSYIHRPTTPSSLSAESGAVMEAVQDVLPTKTRKQWKLGFKLCHGPAITNAGKRQQQVKMVFLILIPFAILLSVALYMNTDSIFAMIQAEQTKSTVEFSVFVGRLIVVLQKEQDQSVLYLSSIGPETKFFLAQTYTETDLYLEELPYWPTGLDRSDRRFFDSKNAFRSYLQQHRDDLGRSNISIYDEILFYKNSIDVFLIWLYDALKESRYSSLWKTLVAYQKVIFCAHYAGIERALGTLYFVEGGFSDPYLYIKYNEVVYVFKNNFEAAMKYSPLVKPISQYNALVKGENLTTIIERYRDQIQFQNISAPSLNDAAAWFDFMSTYLDILFNFQTELAEDILQILNESITRVLTDVASSSLVICIVIIILPITLRAIYNLTNDIQSYAITLAHKTRELNMEKRRTNLLLHQMLPKPVADRLKRKKGNLAEYFKDVTVFFSNIPGFTKMSSELEPMQIIQMLNHMYTIFDSRIEQYDVYKVETIGDSYMVASGLPQPNEHRHATEIAKMALDLRQVCKDLHWSEEMPVHQVSLRIGIHSGPVVAGVVGMKLPRYCLFGDTVNTASRMETHGEANRIHVSLTTWKLLERYGKGFILTSRGKIVFKGKGKLRSYWLEGVAGGPGSQPTAITKPPQSSVVAEKSGGPFAGTLMRLPGRVDPPLEALGPAKNTRAPWSSQLCSPIPVPLDVRTRENSEVIVDTILSSCSTIDKALGYVVDDLKQATGQDEVDVGSGEGYSEYSFSVQQPEDNGEDDSVKSNPEAPARPGHPSPPEQEDARIIQGSYLQKANGLEETMADDQLYCTGSLLAKLPSHRNPPTYDDLMAEIQGGEI